ncbi:MAG: translocation/assembly module TamB domain-containing protein [Bradymonadaceae bacterium]
MRRHLATAGRWALYAAGDLLVLVLLSAVALQVGAVRERLRTFAIEKVESSVGVEVQSGRLEGSLLWNVGLGDLEIRADGDILARVDRLDASYDLWRLATGELKIRGITVVRPLIVVRHTGSGVRTQTRDSGAAEGIEPEQSGGTTGRLTLDSLVVRGGRFVYVDETDRTANGESPYDRFPALASFLDSPDANEWSAAVDAVAGAAPADRGPPPVLLLDDIEIRAAGRFGSIDDLRASVERVAFDATAPGVGPRDSRIGATSATVTPRRLDASLGRTELAGFASLDRLDIHATRRAGAERDSPYPFQIRRYSARLEALAIQPEVDRYLPAGVDLEPTVRTTVSAAGTPERSDAVLRVEAGDASLRASGQYRPGTPRPKYRAHLTATGLQPEAFAASLLSETFHPASGHLALRVEGSGSSLATADATAELAVWKTRAGPVHLRRSYVRARLADGRLTIERLHALSRQLHIEGNGRAMLGSDLTVNLQARARESNRVDLEPPERAKLDLHADMTWGEKPTPGPETLRTADVNLSWNVAEPALPAGELASSEGSLSLDYAPRNGKQRLAVVGHARFRALDVLGLSVERGGLEVDLSGPFDAADLPDPGALDALTGSVNLDVEGGHFGDTLSARRARMGAELSIEDATRGPDLELSASARKLRAGGIRARRIDADATVAPIRKGKVGHHYYALEEAGADLSARGLEGPAFSFPELRISANASGRLDALAGRITVDGSAAKLIERQYDDVGLAFGFDSRGLQLTARAVPSGDDTTPLVLNAETSRPHDGQFTVRSLQIGRTGAAWSTRSPADVAIGSGAVSVDSLHLVNGDHELTVDGTVRTTGRESLDVELRNLDLGPATRPFVAGGKPPLSGRVDLTLKLRGTAANPTGHLTVGGERLTAAGFDAGRLSLELDYRSGRFRIAPLRLSGPDRTLLDVHADLPADVGLTSGLEPRWTDDRFSARVDVPRASLTSWLGRWLPKDSALTLGGSLGARLTAEGTLQHPRVRGEFLLKNGRATGQLAKTSLDFRDVSYRAGLRYGLEGIDPGAVELSSRLDWGDRTLTDFHAELPIPASERLAKAAGDPLGVLAGRRLRAEGSIGKLSFGELPIESLEKGSAEGTLRGNFRLRGSVTDPITDFGLHVSDAGLHRIRDVYLDLSGRTRDRQLFLDRLRLEWDADQILLGRGTIPLPYSERWTQRPADEMPIDFSVQYGPLPVRKLSAFDYTFSEFAGTTAASLRLDGTLASPKLKARAVLAGSHFWRDIDTTYALSVRAEEGRATVHSVICNGRSTQLSARLDFPLELRPDRLMAGKPLVPDEPIDGAIRGDDVDVRHLVPKPLVEDSIEDLEGTMDANLELAGTPSHPQPSGELGLYDVSLVLKSVRRELKNIDLRTKLTPTTLELADLHLQDRSGSLDASGTLRLGTLLNPDSEKAAGEAGKFSADVRIRRLDTTGFTPVTAAVVSSNVDVRGDLRADPITIDVDARNLDVRLPKLERSENYPLKLHADIKERRPTKKRSKKQARKGSTDAVGAETSTPMKIDVTTDRSSEIHHPYGNARFHTDLMVDIRDDETSISGRIGTLGGQIEILGRAFDVSKRAGAIQFTNSNPPNPRLDLEAVHLLDRDLAAQLGSTSSGRPKVVGTVRGRATKPELKLTSNPPLSESEIMYVLSTGRAPTSTTEGEDESAVNQALATASGAFSGLLQQKLAGKIPLDTIRIDPEGSGAKLKVGTYITRDLFLAYAHKFGAEEDESQYEAEIKYHFLPGWVAEAVYGQGNTGDLNVFWNVY